MDAYALFLVSVLVVGLLLSELKDTVKRAVRVDPVVSVALRLCVQCRQHSGLHTLCKTQSEHDRCRDHSKCTHKTMPALSSRATRSTGTRAGSTSLRGTLNDTSTANPANALSLATVHSMTAPTPASANASRGATAGTQRHRHCQQAHHQHNFSATLATTARQPMRQQASSTHSKQRVKLTANMQSI